MGKAVGIGQSVFPCNKGVHVYVMWQEMKGLEEMLEATETEEGGEEGMKALVLEEKHNCVGDLREIQVG